MLFVFLERRSGDVSSMLRGVRERIILLAASRADLVPPVRSALDSTRPGYVRVFWIRQVCDFENRIIFF